MPHSLTSFLDTVDKTSPSRWEKGRKMGGLVEKAGLVKSV